MDKRKLIIDTDTAADDAVALMMAFMSDSVQVMGITTVSGNVNLDLATQNALMTCEICGVDVPVYKGARRPLFRKLVTSDAVHGADGMSDKGLICPNGVVAEGHAVDYILKTVEENPNEIELVVIGPATNIAIAILKDHDVMRKVKHIYTMGTGGFGPGNITPVAEFNVFVDAESYKIMLESGIPMTIVGFDVCLHAMVSKENLEKLDMYGKVGHFAAEITESTLSYMYRKTGKLCATIPDGVAMAVLLWPDVVKDEVKAYCHCCIADEHAYGQVIVNDPNVVYAVEQNYKGEKVTVIKEVDGEKFNKKLLKLFENFAK